MNVVGFSGYSGSGKTTLVEQLVAALRQRGLRVSVVKHAHHSFDLDQPGKDTFRHRAAGAFEVVVASSKRLALLREFEHPGEVTVHQLIAEMEGGVVLAAEGHGGDGKMRPLRKLAGHQPADEVGVEGNPLGLGFGHRPMVPSPAKLGEGGRVGASFTRAACVYAATQHFGDRVWPTNILTW